MILRVIPLQFGFRALDPIAFPTGTAANVFRGALGDILRRTSDDAAYHRIFEPRSTPREGDNPSGFENRPRPFVLRAASLDGKRFSAGERFSLSVNIFDPELPALRHFRQAFEQLGTEGLGPGRPRVELVEARELPAVELNLAPHDAPVTQIRVTFLTPTELKSDGTVLREPRFDALFKRARDRVAGLIALYQPSAGPAPINFRGMGDRAAAVRMVSGSFLQSEPIRRSARTGQRHSLGGFTGEALYEGELAEFLPYLEAAWWTGVGRLTVWGNGWLRAVEVPNEASE